MRIAIIGFGETGACITSLILHEFTDVVVEIIDPSPDIRGRLLDVQHAGAFKNNKVFWNSSDGIASSDFIFFCAGLRNVTPGDRNASSSVNKQLVNEVFSGIKLKSTARIIVLTNPVELMATWISEYFNHQVTVVGTGTLLDSVRLRHIISSSLDLPLHEVDAYVLGEHGEGMTPIWTLTRIRNQKAISLLSEEKRNEFYLALKKSAASIRETEIATKYGVAECAVQLMGFMLRKSPSPTIASIYPSKEIIKQLGLNNSVFISLRSLVSSDGIQVLPLDQFSEEELNQLRAATVRLSTIYEEHIC